jgi:hypothetical protein
VFASVPRLEKQRTALLLERDADVLDGYAAVERVRSAQLWPDETVAADGSPGAAVDGADAMAAAAVATTPGPRVAAILAGIRPGELTAAGRLDFLLAQQRLASWTDALVQPVLVDHVGLVDEPNHLSDATQQDRHYGQAGHLAEVATTLRVSETSARNRLETARLLIACLPLTLAALRSGHLTATHVRVMLESVAGVDRDRLAAVEERVVPGCVARGGAGTPASFGRSCRRAVVAVDAEAVTRRHRRARSLRGVRTFPSNDGMATLEVTSTAADVDVVMRALTSLAGPREADDPRSLDNRRVDALVALCLGLT